MQAIDEKYKRGRRGEERRRVEHVQEEYARSCPSLRSPLAHNSLILNYSLFIYQITYLSGKFPYEHLFTHLFTYLFAIQLISYLPLILILIFTRLTFAVGPRELRGFRMIERHYFRDQVPYCTYLLYVMTVSIYKRC